MTHQIRIRRKVEFAETDMAGIVHFSNFFRYVEAAEAALFDQAGFPLIQSTAEYAHGWPRVRASANFLAPLYFGDTIEVELRVADLKIKAIEYRFRISRILKEAPAELAAKGKMTTVFTHITKSTSQMISQAIPEALAAKLRPPEA